MKITWLWVLFIYIIFPCRAEYIFEEINNSSSLKYKAEVIEGIINLRNYIIKSGNEVLNIENIKSIYLNILKKQLANCDDLINSWFLEDKRNSLVLKELNTEKDKRYLKNERQKFLMRIGQQISEKSKNGSLSKEKDLFSHYVQVGKENINKLKRLYLVEIEKNTFHIECWVFYLENYAEWTNITTEWLGRHLLSVIFLLNIQNNTLSVNNIYLLPML